MSSIEKYPHTEGSVQNETRLFFIDNLRTALTMLVVLHHLVYFSMMTKIFEPGYIGVLFLAFNQTFFMGLFFLISGYFVPSSLQRKGAAHFLRDRFIRLFVPIIFYVFVLSQVQSIGSYIINREPFTWQTYLSHLDYGPMWFVGLLLIFICVYVFWRKVIRKHAKSNDRQSTPLTYSMIIFLVIILAAANFIVRLWIPALGVPGGSSQVRSVVVFFTPSGYDIPQYVELFIIGMIAYRRNWLQTIPNSMDKVGFGMAVGVTILLLPLALVLGMDGLQFSSGWNWASLVYSLWESLFCLGISIGLITLFRKKFSYRGQLRRLLADNAFTVYIIHIPIITTVIVVLKVLHVPHTFMFPATVVVTVPLCFLLAYMIRKLPFTSKVL